MKDPVKKRIQIRSQQGQTMTEFALVLPVLALILFAVIQFGIVFNNYITLTDATRAGARKAAVSRQDANRNSDVVTAVRSSASGLTASKLSVPPPTSTWNSGDDVTVTDGGMGGPPFGDGGMGGPPFGDGGPPGSGGP